MVFDRLRLPFFGKDVAMEGSLNVKEGRDRESAQQTKEQRNQKEVVRRTDEVREEVRWKRKGKRKTKERGSL